MPTYQRISVLQTLYIDIGNYQSKYNARGKYAKMTNDILKKNCITLKLTVFLLFDGYSCNLTL